MPFAVIKHNDVNDSIWVEWETLDDGYVMPKAHRTKAAAEVAMLAMIPVGADPWVYAGLQVERVAPDNRLWVE